MDFTLDSGNTAWMITATALVLLMTPGLAFFYGGMVRAKSVLNMMMMSFISIGTVAVVWVIYGYGLAFGPDTLGGLVGSPSGLVGLNRRPGQQLARRLALAFRSWSWSPSRPPSPSSRSR